DGPAKGPFLRQGCSFDLRFREVRDAETTTRAADAASGATTNDNELPCPGPPQRRVHFASERGCAVGRCRLLLRRRVRTAQGSRSVVHLHQRMTCTRSRAKLCTWRVPGEQRYSSAWLHKPFAL